MFCKEKSAKKQTFFCAAILDHFQKKCLNVTPLLSITFPQKFRISKNIGHPTSESGPKRPLNSTLKVERQTDRHTDSQKIYGQFDL